MTTLLLTGFEPFGGDVENASEVIVEAIAQRWDPSDHGGVELVTDTLPVAFSAADEALAPLLDELRPDLVIAVGEAGRRATITPETLARNLNHARIPDNDGDQPSNQPIDADGADLDARMDVPAIVAAGQSAGLPLEVSKDAGAFLCNHVFYRLMQWTDAPGGFIHVPAWRSAGDATVGGETDDSGTAPVEVPSLDVLVDAVAFVIDQVIAAAPKQAHA